jgi:hypothetical protein
VGFMVSLGFGVYGVGLRVEDSEFRVCGLGFGIQS